MLGLGSAFEKLLLSPNVTWNIGISWPEALRKRAIRYLLHRYVGQFLTQDLSLDQLTVDISNGTGIIKDLSLDIHSLNEVADQLNLPFIFVDGYIGEILVNIPWRNLLSENCFVSISGLKLILRPKQRGGDVSLVDSMIESMSTSMQIAQECLSQVTSDDYNNASGINSGSHRSDKTNFTPDSRETEHSSPIDAIERFAKAIDTILNKVKVRFTDSVLRLEHLPKSSYSGIAVEVKIKNIDYFDEAGFEHESFSSNTNSEMSQVDMLSLTSKKFLIEGVSLFTEEFPSKFSETESEVFSTATENLESSPLDNSEEEFHDTLNNSLNLDSYRNLNSFDANIPDSLVPEDYTVSKNSVLIGKLCNRQEIKLQLRKSENVSGPKVKIEINCGSLIFYSSPRQVHLLTELVEGITSPETLDYSDSLDHKNKNDHQIPMNQSDFRAIERDLIKHISPPNHVQTHALNHHEGWSSPPDNFSDDEFFPLAAGHGERKNPMTSSLLTDISDMEGSVTSVTSHSNRDSSTSKGSTKCDILTDFKVRVNSLCIVILHDDVLTPSMDKGEIITEASIREMQKKSDEFFSFIGSSNFENCYEEFLDLKRNLDNACTLSHLRLVATAIVIDGSEKSSSNKWELKSSIKVGWIEVLELLKENVDNAKMVHNNLLVFNEKQVVSQGNQFHSVLNPKVQININQSQTIQNTGRSRRMCAPKVEVKVLLEKCTTEVDFSLVDRINTLLNVQSIILKREDDLDCDKFPASQLDNTTFFREMMEEVAVQSDTKTNIIINCPLLTVKLFFPIPDLRPLSDMNRVPWWKRNVRSETLLIEAEDFHFDSHFGPTYPYKYEILCHDLHVLFQEKDLPRKSLLRASGSKDTEKGFNPMRILIQNFPSKLDLNLDEEPRDCDGMAKSMMGFLEEVNDNEADIFSKRKMASQQKDSINELTIPSDCEEVNKFINETLNNVQYDIDITLPNAELLLPSKHIYEVVYNRLVSDLLLWMPSAPKKSNKAMSSLSTLMEDLSIGTTIIPDNYSSGTQFKAFSSLKSEDQEKDYETGYASLYQDNYKYSDKQDGKTTVGQTFIGLQVKIINGSGFIYTPFRDEEGKVMQGSHGEVAFSFKKGFTFIASGYKGDIDSCHGCITLNTLNVYHKSNNISSNYPVYLNSESSFSPKKLDCVLHPCDSLYRIGGGTAPVSKTQDCVNICFKMNFDSQKNEKVLELTGGLFGLTLRYHMFPAFENWISQLGDMFNVEDYPVEGYTLPDVVTELNFYFEFCGIDYRPLYLPLKSYVAVDSLAISSNLTIKGNSSVLLIIIEDAALFLSQNLECKKVNLKDNYVSIVDLGVFELCIKLEAPSSGTPVQEMLFSNNVVHIRTCSDSFKAFMELLIYLANEGDLVQESLLSKCDAPSGSVILEPSSAEEMISSQHKQNTVNYNLIENMMQEAMMESTTAEKSVLNNSSDLKPNVDIYLFPDENFKNKENNTKKDHKNFLEKDTEAALHEALKEEPSNNLYSESKQGTDDEYCVLDDIPGTGIKSPSGKPKAKHIRYEHISIKDGHFDPSSNSFEARLSTPEHLPNPHTKYNLQEMSIVWYMYGGEDFSSSNQESDRNGNMYVGTQRNINQNPIFTANEVGNRYKKGLSVAFANSDVSILSGRDSPHSLHSSPILKKPNANMKWFVTGGPNRCHDTLMEFHLNKIKFKYELYPEECPLVSRHVFAVNDIEIRDRLSSSKINKFLYQFSSECCPKQASSNMIQIKAISKRCDPIFNASETNLNISVRPIRLNVDQDALIFLCQFIENVSSDKGNEYAEEEKPHSSLVHAPVMSVNYQYNNAVIVDKKDKIAPKKENNHVDSKDEGTKNSLIYFRNVVFSPDVPIRIDYHGKHIDINSQYGALAGLFIGLGQLDHSEVTLKRVEFKSGVLGVNKLITSLVNEWMVDIRKNQLPSILVGVGPMHSFVKLFGGLKDLIWLPIEQYNKDGRVLRGLQRGTSAFTSSSAYAVLDLTGRFVGCIQSTAETMYDMVSSGPSVRNKSFKHKRGQPKDIREGVTTAFGLMRNGLSDTASTLMKVAAEEHSHKGVSGAVGGVLRQIPPSVFQPIIVASEATCTVIGGMTNQLVPDAGKEAAEKWKS